MSHSHAPSPPASPPPQSLSPPPLPTLPDTALSLIFEHLSTASCPALAAVCKEWNAVTQLPWLWRAWFMSRYPATVLTSLSPGGGDEDGDDEDDGADSSDLDADADADAEGSPMSPLAPSAAHLHLLHSECAGMVEWREAFQARAAVQNWSAALFTPPRRRATPLVERPPTPAEAASPAAAGAGGGGGADNNSSGGGGRGNHRERNHSGGGGGGGGGNGIVRSRSTSWSEERQRHAAARRGSGGSACGSAAAAASSSSAASAGDPAVPVFNNHTPLPVRAPSTSGNLTALTHPNLRGVRHSPAPSLPATLGAHGSPLQRSRPLPIPNPSFGSAGSASSSSPHAHAHSRSLPPASPLHSPSPLFRPHHHTHTQASRSPSLTASYSASSLGSDLEELSLDGCDSSSSSSSHGRDPSLPLILTGHRAAVTCLQFDSSRLAISAGKDVRMYSLRSGTLLEHLSVLKTGLLTCVDFGAARLVTAGTDCAMRCFGLESMQLERVTARKHAHGDVVTAVRLARSESAAVTASLDASVKLWNLDDGQCVTTLNGGDRARTGMLLCMEAVSEVEFLAGGSAGGTGARVALFDVRAPTVAHVQHVGREGQQQMVCSLSYSESNAAIAAGGNDGSVHVLDARMLSSGSGSGSGGARTIRVDIPAPQPHGYGSALPPPASSSVAGVRTQSPLLGPSSSPPSASSLSAEVAALGGEVPSPSRTPPPPLGQSQQSQQQAHPSPSLLLRAPIQSVHLDGSRLLVCQKRAVSIFSAASSSPSHATGLPFAHLERQLSLDDAARFTRPTCPPPLNAFHYMKYSPSLHTLALATTDAVMVWLQARHVFDAQGGGGGGGGVYGR